MKGLAERQAAKAIFEEWKARAVGQGMDPAKVERFSKRVCVPAARPSRGCPLVRRLGRLALLPQAPKRVSLRAGVKK
jgi:hypothetical protein